MDLHKKDNFDMSYLSSTINELYEGKYQKDFSVSKSKSPKTCKNKNRRNSFETTVFINADKRVVSFNELIKRRQSYPGHMIPSLPKKVCHRPNLRERTVLSPTIEKVRNAQNINNKYPPIRKVSKKPRSRSTSYCLTDVIKVLKTVQAQKRLNKEFVEECDTPIKKNVLPEDISPKGLLLNESSPKDNIYDILSNDLALETLINTKSNGLRSIKIQRIPKVPSKIKPVATKEPSKIRWSSTLGFCDACDKEKSEATKKEIKPIIKKKASKETSLPELEDLPVVEVQSNIFKLLENF